MGREKRVLSPEQMGQMGEVLGLRERLVSRLATWEGMRPGEILALQIGDVESDCVGFGVASTGVTSIRRRRNVHRDKLRFRRRLQRFEGVAWAATHGGDSLAFPSENPANPIRRDNIWRRSMEPLLKPVGLQWATFQVMRRSRRIL